MEKEIGPRIANSFYWNLPFYHFLSFFLSKLIICYLFYVMDVENNNPNSGNGPHEPLKKKRSPYRLLVDDVQGEDSNDSSAIGMNEDKISELGLFKGDVVSIKVVFFIFQ